MSKELSYLKENLRGPILRIENPREHSTDEIMKSYFREILVIARRYSRPTVDFEDLVVEGIIGLLDAVRRWDPEKAKGSPRAFHNLAIVRIKSNMFEYFLANNSAYTIPSYMGRAMSLVDQIRNTINSFDYNGDAKAALVNFEDEAFAEAATEERLAKVLKLKEKVASLASNSGRTYEEMVSNVLRVESEIESYENQEGLLEISPEEIAGDREYLEKFLAALKPDARDIIVSLLEGDSLEEAGSNKGLTRERARQIKEEILDFFQRTKMYQDAHEQTAGIKGDLSGD